MNEPIPFAIPDITDAEKRAVLEVLDSGWITTGPKSKLFEKEFARAVGAGFAVALNSCTAAMHVALEALGVSSGDEVVVPSLTFAATAEVVRYFGARPVLVDVCRGDHCLDLEGLEAAINESTRAVIPVHFAGQACDMDTVLGICEPRGVRVIEDAAHAFPCRFNGRKVGAMGDVTCFSFYATKTITTGEGGMAVTDREDLANRMRVMSLHGISKDAWKRYSAEGSWYYEIVAPGFKYNMTDIAAALGLVQLERAEEMLDRRRQIARKYTKAFGDVDALELLDVRSFEDHAWHLFVIKLASKGLRIKRDRAIEELKTRGVMTSVHFIPLHIHPYYRDTYGYRPSDFPVALDCYERSISLPFYSKMSDLDVERVIEAVLDVVSRFSQ